MIEKTGIRANRDYSNPDDVIEALVDLSEKINEIIDTVNDLATSQKEEKK